MLKNYIEEYLNNEIKDKKNIAVLFSGGTDSLTCLFSLLNLGIKPTLYSFHLESVIHRDIEVSMKVAKHFKLKHEIVSIPESIDQLQRDVIHLTQVMNLQRKTNVQCTYPFLHVLPRIKEKYVVSGLCADDLYGTSKSMSIKYANDKEGFDKARVKTFANQLSSAYASIKQVVESYNKVFLAPYRNEKVIDYFMNKTWKELNSPKQKQVAVDSYKEYFDELNVYRRNVNLQVGSKIREWHNELINTELNKNKRNRVDEIYKDLHKEVNG